MTIYHEPVGLETVGSVGAEYWRNCVKKWRLHDLQPLLQIKVGENPVQLFFCAFGI